MNDDIWEHFLLKENEWRLNRFGNKAYKEYKKWINKDNKKILDAGFGSGRFCFALAKDFPQSEIYGIDISPDLVNRANVIKSNLKLENVHFKEDNIFNLSFHDEYFDVVFNEGVIEHFKNYEDAFREMYRVTKKGGVIIIGVPNWYNFPHTLRKWYIHKIKGKYEYGHEKSFMHEELIGMFDRYNMKDIEMTGYYPMQSIIRLSYIGRFSKLFLLLGVNIWGKLIEKLIISPIDKLGNNYISRKFGFEIVIKGIKQ